MTAEPTPARSSSTVSPSSARASYPCSDIRTSPAVIRAANCCQRRDTVHSPGFQLFRITAPFTGPRRTTSILPNRATRGSVCNGLFGPFFWKESYHGARQATRHGAKQIRSNRKQQHDEWNGDLTKTVTCYVVMMSGSNEVDNDARIRPFFDTRNFRNRDRDCSKDLPHTQELEEVRRVAALRYLDVHVSRLHKI